MNQTKSSVSNLKIGSAIALPVYTSVEAMQQLRCGRAYLNDLVRKGKVRVYKPTNRKTLYNRDDVLKVMGAPLNQRAYEQAAGIAAALAGEE
ncbi:MerR family transcriptional regulator [Bifidobacterium leontopitheci]|uniref:Helix-turn-helix domain-containing protein n=2 Tax=Bifidobacterium leontopitheci TaxID=2650774 RepID=A0A6I1GNK9_9BIFI|nr:hypothetical protein [Bifidobacterium leontopitheci]KAB7790897.1 hypothetical protein F7D09_0632 [Bifidobacterium leontopitheci]